MNLIIRTKLNKRGKSALSKAKQLALKEFSNYIRLRDCLETTGNIERGKCITCPSVMSRSALQCGHFLQGRHNSTLFLENNAHAQCPGCNIFKHGNLVEYTRVMIDKYGLETVDMLRDLNKQVVKYTKNDYLEIARVFKQKSENL